MVVKHGLLPPHTPSGLTYKVPAARACWTKASAAMTTARPKTESSLTRGATRAACRRSFAPRAERGIRVFIRGNPFCLEMLARADDSRGLEPWRTKALRYPGTRVRRRQRGRAPGGTLYPTGWEVSLK